MTRPEISDDADLDALRVEPPVCASCGGAVRPGVVWFGEMLPERDWDNAVESFAHTDLVLVIGTSGIVYPAAGLPERAAARGVPIIEINPDPSGSWHGDHQVDRRDCPARSGRRAGPQIRSLI